MERCCHARCAGVPSTRSRQQHERRRAADLDIRTLHGRQAPPPGRQPTTRRQSRPHSGPLRAFQTRRCTSAYPPENPKSARQRRFPAPLAPPGPPRRHADYLEHQSDTGAPSPLGGTLNRRSVACVSDSAPASLTQIGQTLGWLSWHPSTCAISRPSPAPLQAAVCHPRSFDPRGGPRSSRTRHGRRNRGRSAHGPQPGAPSVGAAHLPPDH